MNRWTGLAVTVLATLALAGCGEGGDDGDDEPEANGVAEMKPGEALAAAHKSMVDLDDVTFEGRAMSEGRPVRATMVLTGTGACQLTARSASLGSFAVRVVGRKQYVQADQKALRNLGELTPAQAAEVGDKWIASPADKDFRKDCALAELVPGAPYRAKFRAGAIAEVDGNEVKKFVGRDEDGPMTLWIATTGEPRVLRANGRNEDGPWQYTAAAFDLGVTVTAPDRSSMFR